MYQFTVMFVFVVVFVRFDNDLFILLLFCFLFFLRFANLFLSKVKLNKQLSGTFRG